MSLSEIAWEAVLTQAERDGSWVAACGGTETPYLNENGQRVLYVYHPRSGVHAWLGPDDIVYADEQLTQPVEV